MLESTQEMCRLIGRHIRLSREEKGWNQSQLAERAALSREQVSLIERGATNVSLDSLNKVYGAFGHRLFIANYDPTQPRLPQIMAALNAPNPNT